MDDQISDIRHQLIALRAITANLWSNILANQTAKPAEEARRVSAEMRADLGKPLAGGDDPYLTETIHAVQDQIESFWTSVVQLLEQRQTPGARSRQ